VGCQNSDHTCQSRWFVFAAIPRFRASLTIIDRHYGHLARDGREHAIKLLDALNAPEFQPWTLVDAAWTRQRHNGVTAENKKVELPA
jgi:hypothetical protein